MRRIFCRTVVALSAFKRLGVIKKIWVYHTKFSFINSKFRSTLFKGLQVWAEPIKSFLYIELFGANSLAVCVLRQCLKKQATAFKNVTIKIMHCHCNAMTVHIIISISFSCCYRKFSDFRRYVQAAKRQTVWLSLDCVKGNFCGRCPHPQPLKRLTKLLYSGQKHFLLPYFVTRPKIS